MSTPTSASSQPTSFKTNVNRAKTKRWVEAKSYTYDGDDWGDVDDYDDYGGYDEPPPPPRPTGLRQRGQSATQMPEENFGQSVYQSPVSQDSPQVSSIGASGPQNHYGSRSVTNPPPQLQTNLQRSGPFEPGDERRVLSAGIPQRIAPGDSVQVRHPMQHGQSTQAQGFQAGLQYSDRPLQHQLGSTRPSLQIPNRESVEDQLRSGSQQQPVGNNCHAGKSLDQARVPSAGSSTHSMTSNNSSLDFHNRRDFSPSAMPPPLQTPNLPSPRSDPRSHPPRKSSLSQLTQPSLPFDPHAPSTSAPVDDEIDAPQRERAGSASSSTKPLSFVRPADIYKRIDEEREKERQSQESSRPSMDSILGRPNERPHLDTKQNMDCSSRLKPKLDPVTERKSEYGFEGLNMVSQFSNSERPRTTSKMFELKRRSQTGSSQVSMLSSDMMLPDPTRLSGFGEGFGESFLGSDNTFRQSATLSPAENDKEAKTGKDPPERDLQHQPSKGFTSAVHQAFDRAQDLVPPTPSSTADSSIGRSASGGTSAVSPIMSRGPSAVDRDRKEGLPSIDDLAMPTRDDKDDTLTRHRSVGSFGTMTQASPSQAPEPQEESSEMLPPGFVPGHRRNMSTPSPDNSPSKTPELASTRHLRKPQEVDVAETTPTPPDSVQSASNSIHDFEPPSEANQTDIESHASPSQPIFRQRTDSAGSGKIRNLADKPESNGRPGSEHSNPTPRASMLGSGSPNTDDLASPRPINGHTESFRPHLPGGWESSASIGPRPPSSQSTLQQRKQPSSQISTSYNLTKDYLPPKEERLSVITQVEDATSNAFSAAAEAGNALAGALVAAVGGEEDGALKEEAVPDDQASATRDRAASTNTVVRPEATRPEMPKAFGDDSIPPTPISKDTPRQQEKQDPGSNNFPPYLAEQEDNFASRPAPATGKQPVSLPALSTDVHSGQYESDRLRREIARELSPGMPSDPSTAETESPYQASSGNTITEAMLGKSRESGALPSEYDSYWDENSDDASSTFSGEPGQVVDATTAQRQQGAAIVGKFADPPNVQPVITTKPAVQQTPIQNNSRALQHRFSWEQPLADLASPSKTLPESLSTAQQNVQGPPTSRSPVYPDRHLGPSQSEASRKAEPLPEREIRQMQDSASEDLSARTTPPATEKTLPQVGSPEAVAHNKDTPSYPTGLEVAPPIAEKELMDSLERQASGSAPASKQQSPTIQQESVSQSTTQATPPLRQDDQLPPPPPPVDAQPKLPSFREIVALKTPSERIRAFNETRHEFSKMNTGLAHWLTVTTNKLPEHRDITINQGRMAAAGPGHKSSPSRSKVGGFMSIGGQSGQPYYQQYLDASPHTGASGGTGQGGAMAPSSTQVVSHSGAPGVRISSQQVQVKSKEFLHSAGVFGGKANVAAKGLFSKGKSKLRDASGSKKASPLASPPLSPGPAPRGMQPPRAAPTFPAAQPHVEPYSDHGQLSSHTSIKDSQKTFLATAENDDRKPPSIRSFTQSQLGDDEMSQDSTKDSSDRLPRSSKRYRQKSQPLIPSVNTTETTNDAVQELPLDGLYAGLSKRQQSPHSVNSSNKTPTQASFDKTVTPDLPSAIDGTETAPHLRSGISIGATSEPNGTSNSSQNCSIRAFKPSHSSLSPTRMESDESGKAEAFQSDRPTNKLGLGSSEGAFDISTSGGPSAHHNNQGQHVDRSGNSRQFLEPQQMLDAHLRPSSESSRQSTQEQAITGRISTNRLSEAGLFAPIDGSHSRLRPSQDLSVGRPSIDSLPSRIDPEGSPSPVSPQFPIQMMPQPRGRPIVPVPYDIDHDFGPESNVARARRRSQSRSQSLGPLDGRRRTRGPSLQDHPAFRQHTPSMENLARPAQFYPDNITREQVLMHHQQKPKYALEGIGPPNLPSGEANSGSRRGSRSSAFLKSLAKSITESDTSATARPSGDYFDGSPAPPSKVDTKSKRSSVFRLHENHTDIISSDRPKSKENIAPKPASRSTSSSASQLPPPTEPPKPVMDEGEDEFPIRPKQTSSAGLSQKYQKASTSGNGEEGSKRKRFSVMGSLFGRSGQKRQHSTEYSRKPSRELEPSSWKVNNSQIAPAAPHRSSQNHPLMVRSSTQAPREGYYAPKRGTSLQYEDPALNRPLHSQSQAPSRSYQTDAPAYVQDALLRQPNTPSESTAPPKSLRSPTEFFRRAKESTVNVSVSQKKGRQRGISWAQSSTKKESRQSSTRATVSEASTAAQRKSYAAPQTQSIYPTQQAIGENPPRSVSPSPPPPPPKDSWHQAQTRYSSVPTSSSPTQTSTTLSHPVQSSISSQQQRHSSSPLHTNVPGPCLGPTAPGISSGDFRSDSSGCGGLKAGMTPEEKRKSRQQEIETGHLSPGGAGAASFAMGSNSLNNVKESEEDEPILMSATTYPGQEWQPRYDHE